MVKKKINNFVKCSDCVHYWACSAWNLGNMWDTNATNCTNFENPQFLFWENTKRRNPTETHNKFRELIPYLVLCDGTEYPFRAFYDGEKWGDGINELNVKYWMPLPEPPKGE